MKLRDVLNTEEGYQEIIDKKDRFINSRFDKIKKLKKDEIDGIQQYPKPNYDIIISSKKSILTFYREILETKYSVGEELSVIKQYYLDVINFINDSKTHSGYANILRLISMGIMFEINEDEFKILIELVERYLKKTKDEDFLIDFLINFYKPDWIQSNTFLINIPYKNINGIIELSKKSKIEASVKLNTYISKCWYRGIIEVETHKSKWNIHTGYWSWEAGAIAKILNLDDSSLKDQQYYPYDMVHFKD